MLLWKRTNSASASIELCSQFCLSETSQPDSGPLCACERASEQASESCCTDAAAEIHSMHVCPCVCLISQHPHTCSSVCALANATFSELAKRWSMCAIASPISIVDVVVVVNVFFSRSCEAMSGCEAYIEYSNVSSWQRLITFTRLPP